MSSRTWQKSSDPPRCMLTFHWRQRGRSLGRTGSPVHSSCPCCGNETGGAAFPSRLSVVPRKQRRWRHGRHFLSSVTCRCSSYLFQDKRFVHSGPLRFDHSSKKSRVEVLERRKGNMGASLLKDTGSQSSNSGATTMCHLAAAGRGMSSRHGAFAPYTTSSGDLTVCM
jgi:hypothetical protein